MYYEYHKKSLEFLEKAGEKYVDFFDTMSDESREVRYHLLDYLLTKYNYTGTLSNETTGKPMPINIHSGGLLYWSISHTENFLAFIVSDTLTGIDIAEYRERDTSLFDIHDREEYSLLGGKNWNNFYLLWTAKEAIIKYKSVHLDDMKFIRFDSMVSDDVYKFVFGDEGYTIQSKWDDNLIVSVIIDF